MCGSSATDCAIPTRTDQQGWHPSFIAGTTREANAAAIAVIMLRSPRARDAQVLLPHAVPMGIDTEPPTRAPLFCRLALSLWLFRLASLRCEARPGSGPGVSLSRSVTSSYVHVDREHDRVLHTTDAGFWLVEESKQNMFFKRLKCYPTCMCIYHT